MPKSSKPGEIPVAEADEPAVPSASPGVDVAGERLERGIVWTIIALVMFISTLPFAIGMFRSFPDYQFVGASYNIDDFFVYASWTRQVADGHFFLRNLFTTDPQLGHSVNVYFLLLGAIVRFAHLSIAWTIELARFGGGICLLWLIYRFFAFTLTESRAGRLIAFTFASACTGFGWTHASQWLDKNAQGLPVDTWQPEAFTFLSLSTIALFVVSTIVLLGAMYLLMLGERTKQMKYGVFAGICGLIIGNMHSYDIIHVCCAWGLFLVVRDISARKFHADSWARAAVALVITSPSVAYMYFIFKHDPAFYKRAMVPTHSEGPLTYVFGYGIPLMLAAVGGALTFTSKGFARMWRDREAMTLPICWIVAAFALVYLPSSFQRKMIMGVDIPIGLLGGATLAYLCSLVSKLGLRAAAIGVCILLSLPSGLLFVARDIRHIESNSSETLAFPYLTKDELNLYAWLRDNSAPKAVMIGPPNLMLYVPGYCDRTVWCGHWSETSDYQGKYEQFGLITRNGTPDGWRRAFLKSTGADYLVALRDDTTFPSDAITTPAYLEPVYSNDSYAVYRIHPSAGLVAQLPAGGHDASRYVEASR